MEYTKEQKDIARIAVCFIGAWIAMGIFLFGDIAILTIDLMGLFTLGYLYGRYK